MKKSIRNLEKIGPQDHESPSCKLSLRVESRQSRQSRLREHMYRMYAIPCGMPNPYTRMA